MKPIEFIKLAGNGGRIVSSNDLTLLQIAEAQACNRFYVDPDTSFGWAVLPWHCTTDKDRSREDAIFNRTLPPDVAAAMERYAADLKADSDGGPSPYDIDSCDPDETDVDDYQRRKDQTTIAAHFTTLFKKGS